MVFKNSNDPPLNRSKKSEGEQGKEVITSLSWKLTQVKKQIQAERQASVQERIESNRKSLKIHTIELFDKSRSSSNDRKDENLLSVRMGSPPCRLARCDWVGEKEMVVHSQEEDLSNETVVIESFGGNKSCVVHLLKLPFVEKIPPYSTWIFLSKNQRMAEDQSVVGRRRIYYDPLGSEALICSDTDEEIAEPEEEKHEFSEGEDRIMLKALQEHELTPEVLGVLSQFVNATPDEIEERWETLALNRGMDGNESKFSIIPKSEDQLFLDKTLSGCLDSFDNLFCRRCLVFDCRLHGCSQALITPSEKLSWGVEVDDKRAPCGSQCYLMRKKTAQDQFYGTGTPNKVENKLLIEELSSTLPSESDSNPDDDNSNPIVTDALCADERMASDSAETSDRSQTHHPEDVSEKDDNAEVPLKSMGKRKISKDRIRFNAGQDPSTRYSSKYDGKKQKRSGSKVSLNDEDMLEFSPTSLNGNECPDPEAHTPIQLQEKAIDETIIQFGRTGLSSGNSSNTKGEDTNEIPVLKKSLSFSKRQDSHGWNTIEKDLYLKGVEIFGKNSCLIARNLLSGLKTCMEVASYMFNGGASLACRPLLRDLSLEDGERADQEYPDNDIPARARILRRRGKARKLKYTWKTAGHPSIRKRIADGKQPSCRQYTPCGCQQICSKECPCILNATCCEKYCGCSKSCKNRFRGCHCAKSQCRSRQCPCFAAGRECDPDVCRNCWVSCGDGSLGEPPARGDGYQCGNMKLLLKQQERIMLAKSDVAGWGAFVKNPVNKNDYLGEYTGELISHREADKRGKIYDRANSSFLFDLNDQFVLDAFRKGDKLKFANHSSNPNCYAKVMLVAGDHRVGIYAKEHIDASEELFYDYRYGPDQAPAWARKPEGSKRDDPSSSHTRAHKVA